MNYKSGKNISVHNSYTAKCIPATKGLSQHTTKSRSSLLSTLEGNIVTTQHCPKNYSADPPPFRQFSSVMCMRCKQQ